MKSYFFNRIIAVMALPILMVWSLGISASPVLKIDSPTQEIKLGDSFSLKVLIEEVVDLFAYQFDISFDKSVLSAQSVTEDIFLAAGGNTYFAAGSVDNSAGWIRFTANTLLGPGPGVTGSGALAVVEFTTVGVGTSRLMLSDTVLLDSNLSEIVADTQGSEVRVQSGVIPTPVPEPGALWLLMIGGCWLGIQNLIRSNKLAAFWESCRFGYV
ncbi:MAG: cohesin domain-containing protein [Nitrosomonas ureae]